MKGTYDQSSPIEPFQRQRIDQRHPGTTAYEVADGDRILRFDNHSPPDFGGFEYTVDPRPCRVFARQRNESLVGQILGGQNRLFNQGMAYGQDAYGIGCRENSCLYSRAVDFVSRETEIELARGNQILDRLGAANVKQHR